MPVSAGRLDVGLEVITNSCWWGDIAITVPLAGSPKAARFAARRGMDPAGIGHVGRFRAPPPGTDRPKIAHVEAGLRSFDWEMPEEVNRVVTDRLSDFLFVSEESGVENLRREGVAAERVFLLGNVTIDSLLAFAGHACSSVGPASGCKEASTRSSRSTVRRTSTSRRRSGTSSTRSPASRSGSRSFSRFIRRRPPACASLGSPARKAPNSKIVEPLGYVEFLSLMTGARLTLTDSGGIQEESLILGVPCLTLRENTERPVTLAQGANRLVGRDPARIL